MKTPKEKDTELTPQEIAAYLAGFVDGDGCINAQIVKRADYRLKFQIRCSVTFYQKTKRIHILEWVQKQIGGTLRRRPDKMSELAVVGPAKVLALLDLIGPYVRIKQPQVKLVRYILQHQSKSGDPQAFLTLCEKVDQFTQLNDSKNREITSQVVRSVLGDMSSIVPVETSSSPEETRDT